MFSKYRSVVGAAGAVALAALVAAGCGDGGGGGGGGAAGSDALEYVPQSALLYLVADSDFEGDEWQQAEDHAKKFPRWKDARRELLGSLKGGSDDVTYKDDIKPWLGDTVGVAVLGIPRGSEEPDVVGWAELKDEKKAEDFFRKEAGKEKDSTKHRGYTIRTVEGKTEKDDDGAYAIKDKTLLFSDTAAPIKKAIDAKEDGKNITDAEGVEDVAEEVDNDALVSLVVSGEGVRKLLKEAEGNAKDASGKQSLKSFRDLERVSALKGLSVGVSAEEQGFRMHGFVGYDKDKLGDDELPKPFKPELVEKLPADTILAVGGKDLGPALKQVVDKVRQGDENADKQVAQAEAALDVTVDDIAKATDGEFAVGVLNHDNVVGAVFESDDEDADRETFDKVVGAAGAAANAPAKDLKVAGEDAKQATVNGVTLLSSVFDDKSVLSNDPHFLEETKDGGSTLDEADAYKDARKEADAPGEVSGVFFLDTQGLLKMAGSFGVKANADTKPLGPVFGWLENEDDSQTFDLFIEIDEDAPTAEGGDDHGAAGHSGEDGSEDDSQGNGTATTAG